MDFLSIVYKLYINIQNFLLYYIITLNKQTRAVYILDCVNEVLKLYMNGDLFLLNKYFSINVNIDLMNNYLNIYIIIDRKLINVSFN